VIFSQSSTGMEERVIKSRFRREVEWEESTARVHRTAVNVGKPPYEQITVFLLDHPDAVKMLGCGQGKIVGRTEKPGIFTV
jgi:hypothetical protein